MIMSKLHIKKGDTVKVIAGNSKGQEGKVIEVMTSKYRALIEGVNMVSSSMYFPFFAVFDVRVAQTRTFLESILHLNLK